MPADRDLSECIADLERLRQLVRVPEEVDPELEMASIHLRMFAAGGPAVLYEKVKGCRFRAVSNLFGTPERSRLMFRDTFEKMQSLVKLRNDPMSAFRHPSRYVSTALSAWKALPKKGPFRGFREI